MAQEVGAEFGHDQGDAARRRLVQPDVQCQQLRGAAHLADLAGIFDGEALVRFQARNLTSSA